MTKQLNPWILNRIGGFMNKKLLLIGALILFCVFGVFADPVEGYWISKDENTGKATGGWEIWVENGTLYGKFLSVAGYPQDVLAGGGKKKSYKDFQNGVVIDTLKTVGTTWIYGLEKKSEGVWHKGNIVNPEDGSKYTCKITFHKAGSKGYKVDTLEMRGEIGLGIGRSQYWERATKEEATSIR